MRNTLLFALLGAVYLAVDGHLFTYSSDDSSSEDDSSYFNPSYYVSKYPPSHPLHNDPHERRDFYPDYYVSRTLPKWPSEPHGQGPVYDYPRVHGRSDLVLYRSGRSKKKYQGKPIAGGWWYKMTKKGLISGRWGAPPPPGLEKEHYIYGGYGGGHGGGWGWGGGSGYGGGYGGGGYGGGGGGYGGGWGWPRRGHGGHGRGGHGGFGGHSRGHGGGHGGYGGGGGYGYGGGGGWGWGW